MKISKAIELIYLLQQIDQRFASALLHVLSARRRFALATLLLVALFTLFVLEPLLHGGGRQDCEAHSNVGGDGL